MKIHRDLILFWAVILVLLLGASDAVAVPAFSRTYRTSCVTCHEAYPRRNTVGEAFRLNGYRFRDDESYRKDEPVELGDEAYKRLWPKALWPSSVPARIPLSFVSRVMAEFDLDGSRDQAVMLLFPEEVEAVWASPVGDNASLYGDIIFISKDFGGDEVESWITAKAWLQFEDLFGFTDKFNLRLGTVGTQSMGLFTARDANNFSTHFYQYSTWGMPAVKLAQSGLEDFQGNDFILQPQSGVEVNGFGKRWTYAVGVVSGNVKNPENKIPEEDFYFVGVGEGSDSVDLFFQGAYKIGGLGMDGTGPEAESPLTARPEFWRDDSLMLSLFCYRGTADIEIDYTDGEQWSGTDDFWRLAAGIQLKYKDLMLGAGYMYGHNDRPYGSLSAESVESHSWFTESYYFTMPWLMIYGRYEGLNIDVPADIAGLNPEQDIARFVAGLKALIRPNVTLNVEGSFYSEGEELEEGIDNTLFVLFSAAL